MAEPPDSLYHRHGIRICPGTGRILLSRKLAGMFYGYDTTVLKVFFTAAIVALIGAQFLGYFGLLNLNQVYVNEFYVTASIVGGVIMGAGFIMGGFCPGTGLCAMSIGKVDAMVYILGASQGLSCLQRHTR
ncbi:MAG: YeeE/YedE thiosulfate transporter family protein [Bacteroidales bacterium]